MAAVPCPSGSGASEGPSPQVARARCSEKASAPDAVPFRVMFAVSFFHRLSLPLHELAEALSNRLDFPCLVIVAQNWRVFESGIDKEFVSGPVVREGEVLLAANSQGFKRRCLTSEMSVGASKDSVESKAGRPKGTPVPISTRKPSVKLPTGLVHAASRANVTKTRAGTGVILGEARISADRLLMGQCVLAPNVSISRLA